MKSLRRYDLKNTDYFITNVTFNRRRILLYDISLFWNSWDTILPIAWVVLPEHMHIIINSGTIGISNILHRFKIKYSRAFRERYGPGRVWQNRFWDHIIRDQEDMNQHLDYIHYNAVKHGITNNPSTYCHSSLDKYQALGYYTKDWGVVDDLKFDNDFGE